MEFLELGTYTLFTFGSGSGLANLQLGNTPVGFSGTLSFDADSVDLLVTVVPEPSTLGLIGIGLIGMLLLRRNESMIFARGSLRILQKTE